MKFSTPAHRVVLVCQRCQGKETPTPCGCKVCGGRLSAVVERGRCLYYGRPYGREKILVQKTAHTIRRGLMYSAALLSLMSFGYAVALFFLLVRQPQAFEYSWVELLLIDYRISFFGYVGLAALCYVVYQRVRTQTRSVPVEQFDYQAGGASPAMSADDLMLDWPKIRHIPRSMRVDIARSFSTEVLAGIDAGYLFAARRGTDQFLLNHVLWGLLGTLTGRAMFLRLGFSYERLRDQLFPDSTNQDGKKIVIDPIYSDLLWQCLFDAYHKAYVTHQVEVGVPELIVSLIEHAPEIQDWLFGLGIEPDMVINVVAWMRFQRQLFYSYKELSRAAWFRPHNGMDKAMTAVATPLLNSCSEDVTILAQFGHTEPCVAREREFDELIRILGTTERPALLIADHGIGKKTLVNGLAERMVRNDVPPRLRDKRLVRLSVSALVAGTTAAGAVERLMTIMHEVARAGTIVLCIDNIHELIGISAGSSQSLDVGGALANVLSRGHFMVIGSCTPEAYSRVIATTSLGSIFVPLTISEMDDNQAIQALESKVSFLEQQHDVFYSYGALAKAVELARRFMRETYLPGSALQVLTEAGSLTRTNATSAMVTPDTVATIVAQKTHIPVTAVAHDESTRLLDLENTLHERVIGQEEAVSLVANALRRARAEIRAKNRPIANFLFLGPTGVGKTELTKTIAQVYFGGEERMIRLDMSEYQDKNSIYRLIGSPGQKGSGVLTEAVRRAPFSLILLDELEKADKDILNIFLQVMDDGRLTDSTGRVVDFTNTVIIATSNAGTAFVADQLNAGLSSDVIKDRLLHGELRAYFRPEFLNRFDGIVLFKPLEPLHIRRIARLMLKRVTQDLEEKGIRFVVTDDGLDFIAQVGFDPEFGARPLRRAIEEHVENRLAELVLSGHVGRKSTILLEKDGELRIVAS